MWEKSKKIENIEGKVTVFPLDFKAMPSASGWGRMKIKGTRSTVSLKTGTRSNSKLGHQKK